MADKKPLYVFLHPHRSAGVTIINHIVENCPPEEYLLIGEFMGKPELKEKLEAETKNKKLKYILGHEAFYQLKDIFKDRDVKFFTLVKDPADKTASIYNSYLGLSGGDKKLPFEKWYSSLKKNLQVNFLYERLKVSMDESQNILKSKKFFYKNTAFLGKIRFRILFLLRKVHNLLIKRDEAKKLSEVEKYLKDFFFVGIARDEDLKKLFRLLGLPEEWEQKNTFRKELGEKRFSLSEDLRKKIYKDNPYDVLLYNHVVDMIKSDAKKINPEA